MQNTVCEAHVRIAALRVEAMRGLLSLAPAGLRCDLIQSQLAEAEKLLRHRMTAYSACAPRDCLDACTLFDAAPAETARRDRRPV